MTYYWDQYGDPRDIACEAAQILDGTLPMRPTPAHCLEMLKAKLLEDV